MGWGLIWPACAESACGGARAWGSTLSTSAGEGDAHMRRALLLPSAHMPARPRHACPPSCPPATASPAPPVHRARPRPAERHLHTKSFAPIDGRTPDPLRTDQVHVHAREGRGWKARAGLDHSERKQADNRPIGQGSPRTSGSLPIPPRMCCCFPAGRSQRPLCAHFSAAALCAGSRPCRLAGASARPRLVR